MANAPEEVGPNDSVPEEIQLEVHDHMLKWEEYLAQYHKAIQTETFYTEAKSQDVDDEESQKFFDQKLANAVAQQNEAQENAMCINNTVRQVVTNLCLKHNDALAAKQSRKRKASGKEAGGSSAQVQEPKKKPRKNSTNTVDAAPARQETPRQPTPPRAPSPPLLLQQSKLLVSSKKEILQVLPQNMLPRCSTKRFFT